MITYTVMTIMRVVPFGWTKRMAGERLFSFKPTLPAVEILDRSNVCHEDRLWMVIESLSPEQRERFSRWNALQVLRSWDAPKIVRQYLATGNPSLRREAKSAAMAEAVMTFTRHPTRAQAEASTVAAACSGERAAYLTALWAGEADRRMMIAQAEELRKLLQEAS